MTIHRQHRAANDLVTPESITERIRMIRGQRVLLDEDLGRLYGVPTSAVNQAVSRNPERFPEDFAYVLTAREVAILKSQSVISSWGGRRSAVVVFTEQGVAMLSSVLRSPRAVRVNVAIMRAFVTLRRMLVDHSELARRVDDLEQKYTAHDQRIGAVFEAIRQLLQPLSEEDKDRIGFTRSP